MMKYFGGVEGGASHSRMVICDELGECRATVTGPGTNHWIVGIPECARRIAEMVKSAKADAGILPEKQLTSLGLSLSGCEQEATNLELEQELRKFYPNIATNYFVCSDTLGSLFTASPIGGMVVIAGTGSNALIRNSDGSTFTCGGWGNFFGDEGSAWHITCRAMKIVFDDMDNFQKSPYPIANIWKLIQEHFSVETRRDLLPHCYAQFDKPFFASMCKKMVPLAEKGDQLALFLFREAGGNLARHIQALLPKVNNDLIDSECLNIVCVGSVWLSWPLLKDGFIDTMRRKSITYCLQLIRITKSMAYGACYVGADSITFPLHRNYAENFEVLYIYDGMKMNSTRLSNSTYTRSSAQKSPNNNAN